MIAATVHHLAGQLNAFLKRGVDTDKALVVLSNLHQPDGAAADERTLIRRSGAITDTAMRQLQPEPGDERNLRLAAQVAAAALFLALICFTTSSSWAGCRKSGDGIDVAIGVRTAPPFISADSIRGQRGLSLDLWMSIERELQKNALIGKTEFVECPLAEQLRALAVGDLDLVIAPLTITAERMDLFDFTHQYLSSGITVAQRSSSAIDFGYAIGILRESVTREGAARAILIFLVANLLLAAYMARVLRQRHEFAVIATEPIPLRFYRYTMEAVVRTIGLEKMGDGLRSTATRTLEVFLAVVGTVLTWPQRSAAWPACRTLFSRMPSRWRSPLIWSCAMSISRTLFTSPPVAKPEHSTRSIGG